MQGPETGVWGKGEEEEKISPSTWRDRRDLNSHAYPGREGIGIRGEKRRESGVDRRRGEGKSWRCGGGERYSTDYHLDLGNESQAKRRQNDIELQSRTEDQAHTLKRPLAPTELRTEQDGVRCDGGLGQGLEISGGWWAICGERRCRSGEEESREVMAFSMGYPGGKPRCTFQLGTALEE